MIVVVPPHAAARVPVSNVSLADVPPNGSCMCVCASIPPGITYFPVASTTLSTDAATSVPRSCDPGDSTAAIVSPSMRTSASARPVAETTVPPVMSVVVMILRCLSLWNPVIEPVEIRWSSLSGSGLGDPRVRVGPAVAVELPVVAHLEHHVEVEVPHEQLLVLGGA